MTNEYDIATRTYGERDRVTMSYDLDASSPMEWDGHAHLVAPELNDKYLDDDDRPTDESTGEPITWEQYALHLRRQGAVAVELVNIGNYYQWEARVTTDPERATGIAYVMLSDVAEWGCSPDALADAIPSMLKEYELWLNGNSYGFTHERRSEPCACCGRQSEWQVVDSVWGFTGYDDADDAWASGLAHFDLPVVADGGAA